MKEIVLGASAVALLIIIFGATPLYLLGVALNVLGFEVAATGVYITLGTILTSICVAIPGLVLLALIRHLDLRS